MKFILFISLIFISCNSKPERDYGNWNDTIRIKNELIKKQLSDSLDNLEKK